MSTRQPFLRILWPRCPGAPIRPGFQTYFSSSWRSFASSARRGAATPKQPKRRPQNVASTPKTLNFNKGNIGQLAIKVARQGEVALFEAPSQYAYILSAYGLSAICFGWILLQPQNIFPDSAKTSPAWQRVMLGGVCLTMSVMGTIAINRTSNLIRNIKAVKAQGNLHIRFTVRRMVPFAKPYTFDVLPSQIGFARRLVVSPESLERYQSDSIKVGSTNEPKPKFWKSPVAMLSRGIWRTFISVRQIFTNEDFILLQVEGRRGWFRMDCNGSVAKDFMALGNPVKIRNY